MILLLRDRVSISDGKMAINVHHAECDKSVQKLIPAKYSRFYYVEVKDILKSQLFSWVCRLRTISNRVRRLCFVS